MEEAKKRGSAEEMGEETQSKKLQVRPTAPDSSLTTVQVGVEAVLDRSNNLHLKLLIPSIAAGAIIGKGGETIADIQKSLGARIKMSKANDFYPGTNERVCLVTGDKEAVTEVMCFLTEKVKEKPDPNSKPAIDFDSKVTAERDKQIKVIVPNSTAGMIIGKGGSYIKHLKETSGSFIQLSQKAKDNTLPERVVTIIGDESSNEQALRMILSKIQEDPQSGSCLNISYSEMAGPVANCNPTGSPFANGVQPTLSGESEHTKQLSGYNLVLPGSTSSINLKLNFSSSVPPTGKYFIICLFSPSQTRGSPPRPCRTWRRPTGAAATPRPLRRNLPAPLGCWPCTEHCSWPRTPSTGRRPRGRAVLLWWGGHMGPQAW